MVIKRRSRCSIDLRVAEICVISAISAVLLTIIVIISSKCE